MREALSLYCTFSNPTLIVSRFLVYDRLLRKHV